MTIFSQQWAVNFGIPLFPCYIARCHISDQRRGIKVGCVSTILIDARLMYMKHFKFSIFHKKINIWGVKLFFSKKHTAQFFKISIAGKKAAFCCQKAAGCSWLLNQTKRPTVENLTITQFTQAKDVSHQQFVSARCKEDIGWFPYLWSITMMTIHMNILTHKQNELHTMKNLLS